MAHRERSGILPILIALTVIALLGMIGFARVDRAQAPACGTSGRVLVSWPPTTTLPSALSNEDLAARTFTIGPQGERVRIDVRLGSTFLDLSLTSIFSVRVGTPADLVREAVHPYEGPDASAVGGTTGSAPRAATGSTPPPSRPNGWRARAVLSGDVIAMGTGNEDINEELTLPAGTWYLATDADSATMPITLRTCAT